MTNESSKEPGIHAQNEGRPESAPDDVLLHGLLPEYKVSVHEDIERYQKRVWAQVEGIITLDSAGLIEAVNPAIEHIFDYEPYELIGQPLSRLIPSISGEVQGHHHNQFFIAGKENIIGVGRELIARKKEGAGFPVELVVSELFIGDQFKYIGIIRDTSQRKWIDVQLKQLSTLLNDSSDAIQVIAMDGQFTTWNHGAERMYGYTARDALKMNIRELLPFDRRNEIKDIIERKLQGEYVSSFETQRVANDGYVLDVISTITLIKDDQGRSKALAITDRDITEQKNAKRALEKSETRMRAIVDHAADGIITIDSNGLIESVNNSALHIFGYTADELLGENVSILMPSPYRDEHDGHMRRYSRTLQSNIIGKSREMVGQRKNGETFPLELSISEIRDDNRMIFTGILRDISERKALERSLKDYAEQMKAKNKALHEARDIAESATRAKNLFLANMSHEIRTPLTSIIGFADVLFEADITHDRMIECAGIIKHHGGHLLSLINDILDLSKIEANRIDIHIEDCDPCAILSEVESVVGIKSSEKHLPVTYEFATPLPRIIRTDPLRLKQILLNLMSNAVKFTNEGSVRLVTRFVENNNKEFCLQFDVFDTGVGISNDERVRLFQSFVQANPSTTRKFGGTGLGLVISKKLANMLGGDVKLVSSEPNVGSHFSAQISVGVIDVTDIHRNPTNFLAHTKKLRPKATDTAQITTRIDACRILVAEDGPDNQRLIKHILTKAGAEVTVVENGQLAVDAMQCDENNRWPFDLIITDIQMPVLDGYETTMRLRDKGYIGPIIALTAHAMASDKEKCLEIGCNSYLTKPINRQALLDLIHDHIAQPGSAVTVEQKHDSSGN